MTDLNLPETLQKRLEMPLPGTTAHDEMKARQLNGEFIKFRDQPNKRYGAVMVLLYMKDGSWHFPVIKRPEYDGIHGGQISLPGGKTEPDDDNLHRTALRETEEEIGVPSGRIDVLGDLTSFYVGASNYQVQPVVGFTSDPPSFVPDPSEVAEVIEIPVSELMDISKRREREIDVRGFKLMAPYFDIKSQFIWGATAMMLNEFITVIREI